jgi:hypothetical protein
MGSQLEQYTLEFVELENHLQVTVRADFWSAELAADYNLRLAEKAAEVNAERLLIIRDIPITLQAALTFPLMSDLVERLGPTKVAVVNPFPALKEDLQFCLRVAVNRHGDYSLFENISEAEEWLLGEPRSAST